jgi:DNA-binding response OmpR family regulator
MRVLLLEHEPLQRHCMTESIRRAGHTVRAVDTKRACIAAIERGSFDLAVLDSDIQGASAIEILRLIRLRRFDMPVMVVMPAHNEAQVVATLESGADDCLVKPLGRAEFIARLFALARRAGLVATRDVIEAPPYRIHVRSGAVYLNGTRVMLSPREAQLCVLFFRKQNVLISRAEILETVWGMAGEVQTRTVDTHISKLRKALLLDGSHGFKLQGVYQRGYRLENRTIEGRSVSRRNA